jgi:hypothetical protein
MGERRPSELASVNCRRATSCSSTLEPRVMLNIKLCNLTAAGHATVFR